MKSLKAGDQLFWPACIGMAAGIGLTGFATEFAGLSDSVPFGLPAWSLVLPVGSVAGLGGAYLLCLWLGERS